MPENIILDFGKERIELTEKTSNILRRVSREKKKPLQQIIDEFTEWFNKKYDELGADGLIKYLEGKQ